MVFDRNQLPGDLRAVFNDAQLDDAAIEELWETHEMRCLRDFAEWVTTAAEWNTALACCANNQAQYALRRARLRIAWRAATVIHQGKEDDDNYDKPIKAVRRQALQQAYFDEFKEHLSARKSPSDIALNRADKEIKSNKHTYWNLKQIKSLKVSESAIGKKAKIQVPGGENSSGFMLTLGDSAAMNEDSSQFFKTELQLMHAVEVKLNTYLLAGHAKVVNGKNWFTKDKRNEYAELIEEQVQNTSIGIMLDAHHNCWTRVIELLRGDKVDTLDEAITAAMGHYMAYFMKRPSMKGGKGGGKSMKGFDAKHNANWDLHNTLRRTAPGATDVIDPRVSGLIQRPNQPLTAPRGAQLAVASGKPRVRTAKTAVVNGTEKEICKFHNDDRTCFYPGSCGKEHCCDVKRANGQACGSKDHTRYNCPHINEAKM